jgi:DNA-directed RNA polymerase beta' subunit
MHTQLFESNDLSYGSAWLQLFINRLYILDSPLELTSFSAKWRPALLNFLSVKWFQKLEKREMLSGGLAIFHLLENLKLTNSLEDLLDKWVFCNSLLTRELLIPTLSQSLLERNDFLKVKNKTYFCHGTVQSKINAFIKRFLLFKKFVAEKNDPKWMILFYLPILPPDLRPIVKLRDGQIILSDLNELYRIILTRNLAISQLSAYNVTAMVQKVLLQRAVDALFGNGIGLTMKDLDSHPYKSISDVLIGKEGRLRENLLGKRVDYSGRSVIVVGPHLQLYQCGLPKEMAIELFQPFLIFYLLHFKLAETLREAKDMISSRISTVWTLLSKVIQNHSIVLNRAPTLHRLGVQSFQPILVSEQAIHLHPLVCAGFNADFDGDQMAVHVPLSLQAQAEACTLMSPYFNLLSPATGEAITVPSQDMLLGLYALTLETRLGVYKHFKLFKRAPYDTNMCYRSTDVFKINSGSNKSQEIVWLLDTFLSIKVNNHAGLEKPIEIQYDVKGYSSHLYQYARLNLNRTGKNLSSFIRTTLGRLLLNQQIEQAIQSTTYFYDQL